MLHRRTIAHPRVAFQRIGEDFMANLTTEQVARMNNIEDVMDRLKIGRSRVYEELGTGRLRSVKIGRRRLIPESAIVEFIEKLEAGV
jgi:excisionase family DNA binding protein